MKLPSDLLRFLSADGLNGRGFPVGIETRFVVVVFSFGFRLSKWQRLPGRD